MKLYKLSSIIIVLLLLTVVWLPTVQKTKAKEVKYDSDILNLVHNDSSNTTDVFILGDSNSTIAERNRVAEVERLQEEERARTARKTVRGDSYSGFGEATRVYQDQTNDCVTWAKRQLGIPQNRSIGDGARKGIQGYEPKVGAIGAEKGVVHAFVVIAIEGDNIRIRESNYYKGWITERVIPKSRVIGYIYGG